MFNNFKNVLIVPVYRALQYEALLSRSIQTSAFLALKAIKEVREGKKLTVEGVIEPSPRLPYLLKINDEGCESCPLCRINMEIKHTDVLILSQFVRSDGLLLPRRITGLCSVQQRRLTRLVSMAHIAGLMPNLVPFYSKPDCFKKRRDWKKYNTYFDERTIMLRDRFYSDKNPIKIKYYLEKGFIKQVDEYKYVPAIDNLIERKIERPPKTDAEKQHEKRW